jgi:transcriptional regulator with XRE-family HTH domain
MSRERIGKFTGLQIISHRKALRWSQTELGKRVGVSRQAVQQWESGELPSWESLYLVAQAFACEPWALLPSRRQVK